MRYGQCFFLSSATQRDVEVVSPVYNMTTCCLAAGLLPQCMPLCSYNFKISDLNALGSTCTPQMGKTATTTNYFTHNFIALYDGFVAVLSHSTHPINTIANCARAMMMLLCVENRITLSEVALYLSFLGVLSRRFAGQMCSRGSRSHAVLQSSFGAEPLSESVPRRFAATGCRLHVVQWQHHSVLGRG